MSLVESLYGASSACLDFYFFSPYSYEWEKKKPHAFIQCPWWEGETDYSLGICSHDTGWKEKGVKLCMEEPPRTLDLGETGFGVGHLGLVTTCLSQTLVVTVAEQ